MVARAREQLQAHCDCRDHDDRTLLVIKRTKG
jgi:hypothetical protein